MPFDRLFIGLLAWSIDKLECNISITHDLEDFSLQRISDHAHVPAKLSIKTLVQPDVHRRPSFVTKTNMFKSNLQHPSSELDIEGILRDCIQCDHML